MAKKVNVRCSRCEARDVFTKHPDEYTVPRTCGKCGHNKFRVLKNRAKDRCNVNCECGGYQWLNRTETTVFTRHQRGTRFCLYNRDGSLRERDEFGIATYSCPHDGIPRWPAIYCAEATRPGYSRWHFGWQASQAAGAAPDPEVADTMAAGMDSCAVPGSAQTYA